MKMKHALGLFILGAVVNACGDPKSHRESTRDQNESNVTAEKADLAHAEGRYEGTLTMAKSHQTFDGVINIKITYDPTRSNSSADPTQPLLLPKLSGYMSFPFLDNLDVTEYSNYLELVSPMGGFAKVLFELGDFDPKTNALILPYTISGYAQGNFGELIGNLKGNNYSGVWFAKPIGDVATFRFEKVDSKGRGTP